MRSFYIVVGIRNNMADELKFTERTAEDEESRFFNAAIDSVLTNGKKDYPSYVGGFKVASGNQFQVCSPVDKSIIFGSFQEPEDGLMDRAVVVAKEAFAKWSKTSAEERTEIFDKALETIEQQKYRLAAIVSLSVGMKREDALEEVGRLIEVIAKACDDIEEKKGKAIGVWAVLTSHNSPLAAPMGYACAAMIAGNSVIMIPSVRAPVPVYAVYEILEDAGLPGGVLNVVVDRSMKYKCTTELANNPDVSGIVAAGSGQRMEDLMFLQMDDELRFINEIKGMNPILVYKPSSMKEAAKTVINSAFSFMGQRLDSCSKVVVLESEQKAFIDALVAEAKNIKITDPNEPDAFAGPIISERKVKAFEDLVDELKGNIIYGGKKVKDILTENGYYVTPAIVMGLDEEHDLNNMDSALPILSVQVVEDVDQAIDIINCTEYGMCAGVITKDASFAERFVDEINADEVFINDHSKIIGVASRALVSNFME